MATFGTLKAGALVLTNQNLDISSFSVFDSRFQNIGIDGTSRLRVSHETRCLLHFNHVYDKEPYLFEEKLVAGGTSSLSTNAYIAMEVTSPGDKVIRQSYQYVPHQVGCNKIVIISATLTTSTTQPTGVRTRVGVFDDIADKSVDTSCGNGFFFQLQNNNLQVVKRFSTGVETQADQVIDQPYFSEDVLDGSGSSTLTFTPTETYNFFIDFFWSGTGVVRMGVLKPGGGLACAHTFSCSSTDFCKYATLPVRCEISNVSSPTPDTLHVTSGTVWLEGPREVVPRRFEVNTGAQTLEISSLRVPVLSIRLKSTANRATSFVKRIMTYSSDEVLWEILLNPVLTGSSWTSTLSAAKTEVDMSATSSSGGTLVFSMYGSSKDTVELDQTTLNCLHSSIEGSSSVLTLTCSKLTLTASVLASMTWEEI